MTEKSVTIAMESLVYHEHYNETGQRVAHEPGDTYDLHDCDGMTAEQLAASFEAMRVAKRVDAKTLKPATANPATGKIKK